ncbi:hypothetical protein [Undibacterium flavidum]|uniref:DUF2269 family protein n=1 Tax=Undibacterium flavidum TaxID=2762297 RepID=A0ABR6Y9T8_9BURK|nr:hypothetical protein [Undibacterium flavidum]MBC3873388.1 hypothetical protein [Undibacterium flavidum]
MTPNLLTRFAIRLHAFRWSLLAAALTGIVTFWAAVFIFVIPGKVRLGMFVGIAAPPIFLTWAALCCAFWFHPTRGFLRSDNSAMSRLPVSAAAGIRWYASIFLSLFVVASVLVPLFVLTSF